MRIGWALSLLGAIGFAYAADCPQDLEGQQVAAIEFSGLERTDPGVVRRELLNGPGRPFSCAAWRQEREALLGLDLFAEVALEGVSAEATPADSGGSGSGSAGSGSGLDLRYRFRQLPGWIAVPSVKSSDRDGFMAGPALVALDLGGQDLRLEAHWRTTLWPDPLRAQEFLLMAELPWTAGLPMETQARLVRNDSWNSLQEYHERSWESGLDLQWNGFARGVGGQRVSGERGRWSPLLAWEGWKVEHDGELAAGSDADPAGTFSPHFLSGTHHDIVQGWGVGAVRESRDSRIDPSRGGRWEARATGFGGPGSNVPGWSEWLLDLRHWGRIDAAGRHRWHFAALGRWRPLEAGQELPFWSLWYLGGANTVRGHMPDPEHRGVNELLTTLEWRWVALERWTFSLGGNSAFLGLQCVAGVDEAWQGGARDDQGERRDRWLQGLYGGVHLLVPGLDRLRFEVGVDPTDPGVPVFTLGLYEKSVGSRWKGR